MRRTLLAGTVIGLVAALGLTAPAQAQPAHHPAPKAVVRVLHAVPKLPVDVYVDGARVLDDFQPGTFSPKLKLAAGRYRVAVTAADAPDARHPLLHASYRFVAGGRYTVAAHLTAKGAPTLTKYRNRTADVSAKKGRITVRHDAAAPAVDVLVNGAVAFRHLRNPHEALTTLKVGTYSAAVAVSGTKQPVIGPADVTIKKHVNTIVYAWGSAADGTLALAVEEVALH